MAIVLKSIWMDEMRGGIQDSMTVAENFPRRTEQSLTAQEVGKL